MPYGQIRWLVLALFFFLPQTVWSAPRTWTDSRNRQIQAEFLRVVGNDVVLQQPNGRVVRIPFTDLSEADQEFMRTLLVSQGFRRWTNLEGKQIEAQYLRVREGKVYVTYQGAPTSFPLTGLSVADRRFVRAEAAEAGQQDELPPPGEDENLPPPRAWTDQDDNTTVGEFDRILPDGRVLLAVEGATLVIPVKNLSEADHDYLRELLEPQGLAQLVPPKPQPEPEPEPPVRPEPPIVPEPPVQPPVHPNPPVNPKPPQPPPPVRPNPPVYHPPVSPPPNVPNTNPPQATPARDFQWNLGPPSNSARACMSIGGLMALIGVWWIGAIALQQGNTVFGILCFCCCGLAALIYGLMNTETCGGPLALFLLGVVLQIVAPFIL